MKKYLSILFLSACLFFQSDLQDASAFSWYFGSDPNSTYSATYYETNTANDNHYMFYIPITAVLGSNEILAGAGMDVFYNGTDTDPWLLGLNMGKYMGSTDMTLNITDGIYIKTPTDQSFLPVGTFTPNLNNCTLNVNVTGGGFFEFPPINSFEITISGEQLNPVPEPSTFLLLGAGIAGIGIWRRRSKSV